MDLSNVKASLKYGRVPTGKEWAVFVLCNVLSWLCAVVGVVSVVIVLIRLIAGKLTWNNSITIIVICGSILVLAIFVIIQFLAKVNKQARQDVKLWAADAVELDSIVRRMDTVSKKYKPFQIQVEFEYYGQKYQKLSAPGNMFTGYFTVFAKYANRKVKILYSPKYDEVMIIKKQMLLPREF